MEEPRPQELLSQRFAIHRFDHGLWQREMDAVAREESLQILISYSVKNARFTRNLALTMRTPGHDKELTAGYLVAEGIIQSPAELLELRYLGQTSEGSEMLAELAPSVDVDAWRTSREAVLNSSCGICGKRSVEALLGPSEPLHAELPSEEKLTPNVIGQLGSTLRADQGGFGKTGGLHAAGLFDMNGSLLSSFEDIGRHNALDKLVGRSFLSGQFPLSDKLLFLSSRSSFELVQKTVRAGAYYLLTVGAPSSLAIATARAWGITLIGFVRDERFNIYSGEWRIKLN